MILNLFPHLLGSKILHGSPGYPTEEVIKSIRTDRVKKNFITLEFESGTFTYMDFKDFDRFLEEGKVYFQRAAGRLGFEAPEVLMDVES